MANNNFSKTSLDLTSPICMDINDNVVRPFDSFNKKNAAFFGDQLSPLYVTEEHVIPWSCAYSNNGDKWEIRDNQLQRNDVVIPGKMLEDGVYSKKENFQLIWQGDDRYKGFDWEEVNINRKLEYKVIDGVQKEVWTYYASMFDGSYVIDLKESFSKNTAHYVLYSRDFYQESPIKLQRVYLIIADFDKKILSLYSFTQRDDNPGTVYSWEKTLVDEMEVNYSFKIPVDADVYNPYITCNKLPNGMYALSLMYTSGTKINKRLKPINVVIKDLPTFDVVTDVQIAYNAQEYVQYYRFPFYIDNGAKAVQGAPIVPAIYYVGKYDDEDGEDEKPIFFFGHAYIDSVSFDSRQTVCYLNCSWDKWFQDEKLLKNAQDIRKKVAVSYTLYPNYYHQCGCIKRDDIFIPFNFHKAYDLGQRDNIFNGVNLTTVDISEETVVYNDLPDVAYFKGKQTFNTGPNSATVRDTIFYMSINNGYRSGISSSVGNLLAPWNSFTQDVYFAPDDVIYLYNEDGTQTKVTTDGTQEIKSIYNDRYILTNTNSEYNAYDIKKGKWFNWTSGYNGNLEIFTGWIGVNRRPTQSQLEAGGKKANNLLLIASAENPNYEISGNPFISSIFPATRLLGVVKVEDVNIPYVITYPIASFHEVDIYKAYGDKSIVPLYEVSYSYLNTFVKTDLLGLAYPESPNLILSLSLCARFIKSYNNHDFVIEDDKSYPLIYSNNYPIFAYRALTFIENVSDVFVIQNSNYLIFDNKIMAVAYQGDQLVNQTIVADITGMKFIGNTNQVAFFYSKLAKKIYAFTGDTVLREQRGANVIDKVYRTYFIPADNTIVVPCMEHDGTYVVYFFGTDSFLRLENIEVENCYYGDGQIILTSYDWKAYKIGFVKRDGAKKIPIELQTGYFGIGNEMSSVIDCWYIRLFDEDRESGDVTIQQNTLTNIGCKTESKTIHINRGDWDEQTNSYLIRYQPRYQNGVGIQLNLKSDFAIYEIVVSSRQGETQLTAPKAQI